MSNLGQKYMESSSIYKSKYELSRQNKEKNNHLIGSVAFPCQWEGYTINKRALTLLLGSRHKKKSFLYFISSTQVYRFLANRLNLL